MCREASSALRGPVLAQRLSLEQNGLHGCVLQVRRVAKLVEDSLRLNVDAGTHWLSKRPFDGDAVPDRRDQFRGDRPQLLIARAALSLAAKAAAVALSLSLSLSLPQ